MLSTDQSAHNTPTFYQLAMFICLGPMRVYTSFRGQAKVDPDFHMLFGIKKKSLSTCSVTVDSLVVPCSLFDQCFYDSISGHCSLDLQRNNLVSSSTCHLSSNCQVNGTQCVILCISLYRSFGQNTGFLHRKMSLYEYFNIFREYFTYLMSLD